MQPEGARPRPDADAGRDIREDVAEDIGREDDVEDLGMAHELERAGIDIARLEFDVGKALRDLARRFEEKPVGELAGRRSCGRR